MAIQVRPFDSRAAANERVITDLAECGRLQIGAPMNRRGNDSAIHQLDVEMAIIEVEGLACCTANHPSVPQSRSCGLTIANAFFWLHVMDRDGKGMQLA